MLEQKIEELTRAVVQLTAALNATSASQGKVTKTKEAKPEPVTETFASVKEEVPMPLPDTGSNAEAIKTGPITQADLRDVAQRLLAQKRLPDILRINKEHGIRRITECPEDKYESVHAALTAALADAQGS